jgi:probable rRNA maturation factor
VELDVTVQLQSGEWKSKLRPYCKTVREACFAAISETKLAKYDCRFTMAVVLADDDFIRELNHTYRSKDKPTNVLSFPSMPDIEKQAAKLVKGQEEFELGDIVMAYSTVAREAGQQEKTFRDHAIHLLVHGTLHLLGHDHEEAGQAAAMERTEIKILKKQNIKNPYL